jgi:probable rRNA maturation factor
MKAAPLQLESASGILHIDVTVDCSHWDVALPDAVKQAKDACEAAFRNAGAYIGCQAAEVSVVLANDVLVKSLNCEYRNSDEPTNVLSFPTAIKETPHVDIPILLGDIIVAYETIVNEANIEGKSLRDHFYHLIVHGMLHLLGFDHQVSADADIMEAIEVDVLQKINIENPYEFLETKGVVSS